MLFNNRTKQTVEITNDHYCIRAVMTIISIFLFFTISVIDKNYKWINWPNNTQETIGTASEILATLIGLLVSVIGIAVSLKKDKYYNVDLNEIYTLSKSKKYTLRKFFLFSIIICALIILSYSFELTIASIGVFATTLLFAFRVVYEQLPLLSKDKKKIDQLLKDNFIYCYIEKDEPSKEFKDAIKYMLYRQSIIKAFTIFKDSVDEDYNTYLLLKLLEFQSDIAFEIKNNQNEYNSRIVFDTIINNVVDVILRRIQVSDKQFEKIIEQKHLLIRVLYYAQNTPETNDIFSKAIATLVDFLSYQKVDADSRVKLATNIVVTICAYDNKEGRTEVLKIIRRKMSTHYSHNNGNYAIELILALVSFQIYYLCTSEPDYPDNYKNTLIEFIRETNKIEEQTKIKSWETIFTEFNNRSSYNFSLFYKYIKESEYVIDYYLYSDRARFMILDDNFIANWYITNLLNSYRIFSFDYSDLIKSFDNHKHLIRDYGEKSFDENKTFVPTEQMETLANFFCKSSNTFGFFIMRERSDHKFFNLVNDMKLDDLEEEMQKVSKIDNKDLENSIKESIESSIKKEWGYNKDLIIDGENRYIHVVLEKFLDPENYKKSIYEWLIDGIYHDIYKNTPSTKIYHDTSFEEKIESILKQQIEYVTPECANTSFYYIKSPKIQKEFKKICDSSTIVTSNIFNRETLISKDGFCFNCELISFEIKPLNEDILSKETEKHRREDGQYYFDGTFMPKETIEKHLKNRMIDLLIVFHYSIDASQNSVFNIFTYLDMPKDDSNSNTE